MSIRTEIEDVLGPHKKYGRSHPNFEMFVDDLARFIEALRITGPLAVRLSDEQREVQRLVAQLSRRLKEMEPGLETAWAPFPEGYQPLTEQVWKDEYNQRTADYLKALREWVQLTIALGDALPQGPSDRVAKDIENEVFVMATMWEGHFAKAPKATEEGPFYLLCREFLPAKPSVKTVRKALKNL